MTDDLDGRNILQRIQMVRREVSGIDKKGKHSQGFRFVTHDDVTNALSGLFVRFGIDRSVSVLEAVREGQLLKMTVEVRWTNVDAPEDFKSVRVYCEGVDNGTRRDGSPNIDGLASGKALSYAVKMAELKNFCLAGDSTPDNERSTPLTEAAPPTDVELQQLKELYKSCGTKEELAKIRGMVAAVLNTLSHETRAELDTLDKQARTRAQ